MRAFFLAAVIGMTFAASSMAQTPTPAPAPGQSPAPGAGQTPKLPPNSGAAPQPLTNGVQSSNGAKIAPNGGISSGVGLTTTTPTTGGSSTPATGGGVAPPGSPGSANSSVGPNGTTSK